MPKFLNRGIESHIHNFLKILKGFGELEQNFE